MPNWCDLSGYIHSDKQTLDNLWSIIHEGSMESDGHDSRPAITALRPCPEDLTRTMSGFMSDKSDDYEAWNAKKQENMAKYGYTDWYGWCVDNWGTKWTPDLDFERHDDTSIWFHGQSAWSPPEELMRYISDNYPVRIEMTYLEEGMSFVGCSIYEKGQTYESSGEPTAQWNDDFSNDDEYHDALDRDRDYHEGLAQKRYEQGLAEPKPTLLLGRDILPKIGEASVTTTLTGEVVLSLGDEVTGE